MLGGRLRARCRELFLLEALPVRRGSTSHGMFHPSSNEALVMLRGKTMAGAYAANIGCRDDGTAGKVVDEIDRPAEDSVSDFHLLSFECPGS